MSKLPSPTSSPCSSSFPSSSLTTPSISTVPTTTPSSSSSSDSKDQEKIQPFLPNQAVTVVANHYNALPNPPLTQRKHSIIYQLRCFNNWVKAILIQTYFQRNSKVLDLGCGRGGDLMKYHRAQVQCVYGFDIAEASIQEAKQRFQAGKYFRFKAHFQVADCFNHPIVPYLSPHLTFDVVCMQFCLHYAFASETCVRQTLENVTCRLKRGGIFFGCTTHSYWLLKKAITSKCSKFGNSLYSVTFPTFESPHSPYGHSYTFQLSDAIQECPEFWIHWPTFEKLALEYGLVKRERLSFHEFYQKYQSQFHSLLIKMDVLSLDSPTLTPEEWEAAGLYTTFVFEKQ